MLQIKHEKLKPQVEVDKQWALESMKCETEQLIREGKLSLEAGQGLHVDVCSVNFGERFSSHFDLVGNLWLILRFSERDPETFLLLFQRVANTLGCSDVEHRVMLQCVLTGKAQET